MNDIQAKILAMGLEFSPAQMAGSAALFGPMQPAIDEATVQRDVFYGDDPRHRLDLFGAEPGGTPRPVVIYIHGGGFVGGDKGGPGTPFYSNVGAWAAAQGWLGVVATYRLAPAHPWPAGAEDMARLVAWLRAEAGAYGGDPDKIVLVGQSAGAAHIASYVGGAAHSEIAAASLAGAVMLSGIYDIARADRNPFQVAYYGTDESRFAAQSSIEGLARTTLPCLYTVTEHDPVDFQRQAAWIVARRAEVTGKWPDFHRLQGQNHITPGHQINTPVDEVGPLLAAFIKRVTA